MPSHNFQVIQLTKGSSKISLSGKYTKTAKLGILNSAAVTDSLDDVRNGKGRF